MAKRKRNTDAFVKDLLAVFDKHNWSGEEISIHPAETLTATEDHPPPCNPGEVPVVIVLRENGFNKRIVVCRRI